ncbi:MAG TPA: murein biosynthesis integral membrane protein MurJ [Chloroflexi bacterium]|nr:murein biosynthesis integral membrane protein MurJ [Chloroflexota bacterium]
MISPNRQIARSAALVMVFFVLSRVLGLARQMVVGAMFGAGAELDAFWAANRVPDAIFLIVAGGALGSAFIPAFAERLARENRAGAWRLASAVVNLALLLLTVLAALTALCAPALVSAFIAPGFDPAQQALTTDLLRLMLVSPVIFGVSGIVMGVLNAHQHFLLPALAPSIYNLSIIGGAVLLGPWMGVRGMALGAVAGAALHLLVQTPGLFRYGARYVPALGLNDPGVREVGRLMAPRVLGTAIVELNFFVNNSLASAMGEGAVSAINYAWLLMLLPQGVFAQAVGTAAFPTFAAQAARGERDEMRRTLAATLRTVFVLCLPATVGLIALGRPLVTLLFQRGAFDADAAGAVAWALAFYALGLVGHAGLEIVARAFYALHDTFTPVWVGGLTMALNVGLSLTLPSLCLQMGCPPHAGLALANSVATLLELVALVLLIRRRVGGLQGRRMLVSLAKSGVASLAMGAGLWVWQAALGEVNVFVVGGGGVILGVLVYVLLAFLLRLDELRAIARLARPLRWKRDARA